MEGSESGGGRAAGPAAGAGRAIIFRKGQKARIVSEADMLSALMEEVGKVEAEMLVEQP